MSRDMPTESLNYSSVEPSNRKQMELDRVTSFRITFTPFLEETYRVRVVSVRQCRESCERQTVSLESTSGRGCS